MEYGSLDFLVGEQQICYRGYATECRDNSDSSLVVNLESPGTPFGQRGVSSTDDTLLSLDPVNLRLQYCLN